MLSNCNSLSATRFALAQKEFKKHTALLVDMKKDLDNIFKRIRTIKTKLSNQYPAAFAGMCLFLAVCPYLFLFLLDSITHLSPLPLHSA